MQNNTQVQSTSVLQAAEVNPSAPTFLSDAVNITNGNRYSGDNAEILNSLSVKEVCTFKQGVKHFKISGKQTLGLKSIASLIRYVLIENKGETRTVPRKFAVFNADDWKQRQLEIIDRGYQI